MKGSWKNLCTEFKLVYKLITTEKQPNKKTSEIKSFMEQNCWSLSMENPYVSVYEHTNSLKGNPKLIENAKIQLTVLLFGIRKQWLMRQRQSGYYSGNWSKFKAVEYSKGHSLELLLDKKNIRWKYNYEAKEFNHLVWHQMIGLLIQCRGILEIVVQSIYIFCRE